MNTNKKVILIVLVIIVVTTLIYIFIINIKKTQPEEIIISTKEGNIKIPDITKKPVENLSNNGVTFRLSNDFSIEYYPQDKSFIITLLSQDVAKAQREAEDEFIRALNISKENACKLSVSIGIPFSVNENLAGKVYKLSFCPGGKILQ